MVFFEIRTSSKRTTKLGTEKIPAKWLIINVSTRSYVAQSQGNDLPPVIICLEAPLSD